MLFGRDKVLKMLSDDAYGYNHAHFINDFIETLPSLIACTFTGLLYASMFGYLLINFADTFAWVCLVGMQLFLIFSTWLCFTFY